MVLQSRAHHIGSLLRPFPLITARELRASGYITENQYQIIEDGAVCDAIKLQLEAGFSCINDGEYSRDNFWGGFFPSLAGFEFSPAPPHHFRLYLPWGRVLAETGNELGEHRSRSIICKGSIRHVESAYLKEVYRLQKLLVNHPAIDYKITLISPTWHHIRYKPGRAYEQSPYTNDSEYFSDLVVAYQTEIAILYRAGLRNIQIDAPEFSFFWDERIRADLETEGQDPDMLLRTYIDVLNQCLAGREADLHVGVHICRGNFESNHFVTGSYERVTKVLFENVDVNTFYLEYDTQLAGNFDALASLPANKNVVLGIVTTKSASLENPEELRVKILEVAQIMAEGSDSTVEAALLRIGVSPQCGFASTLKGHNLTMDEMAAKLSLVNQIADGLLYNYI